jgi:hypothetical protein
MKHHRFTRRPCSVRGCMGHSVGFGRLCAYHDKIRRRRGHPEQPPITLRWLKPFKERVQRFLDENGDVTWSAVRKAWADLATRAANRLLAIERRMICVTYERRALQELVSGNQNVPEDDAIITLLAFGLIFQEEPGAFRSHQAFLAEVARRFRAMNPSAHLSYFKNGKTRRVPKDLTARTVQYLGRTLAEGFAVYGVHIGVEMERRAKESDQTKQKVLDAIKIAAE